METRGSGLEADEETRTSLSRLGLPFVALAALLFSWPGAGCSERPLLAPGLTAQEGRPGPTSGAAGATTQSSSNPPSPDAGAGGVGLAGAGGSAFDGGPTLAGAGGSAFDGGPILIQPPPCESASCRASLGTRLVSGPGALRTCALLTDGSVRCWGALGHDDIGDPTSISAIPIVVDGANGATAMAAGDSYACAVLSGSVTCWGHLWVDLTPSGSAGTSGTQQPDPWRPTGVAPVSVIASGSHHACVVTTGGAVQCWGGNSAGDLGDDVQTSSPRATTVSGLSAATAVAAGFAHTCAIAQGGAVACWGDGTMGQTGDPQLRSSSKPVFVNGLAGATAIAAGGYHTCAVVTGGKVACWGYNPWGQLGATTDQDYHPQVVEVPGVTGATAVTAGEAHTCALANGSVICWGFNGDDQLGTPGSGQDHTPIPTLVPGVTEATAIAAGNVHTCAVTVSGGVRCWGNNSRGQLGAGTKGDPSPAVAVVGL
jgi:alpha-tubulin suppressor-like RCC1 family protein